MSGLTIFIAGLWANFEYDLRKIIALSTLRQLGFIIMTISVGLSDVAFFHLLTHALLGLCCLCVLVVVFYGRFSGHSFYGWLVCLYTFYFVFNGI